MLITCAKCGRILPEEMFTKDFISPTGRRNVCLDCHHGRIAPKASYVRIQEIRRALSKFKLPDAISYLEEQLKLEENEEVKCYLQDSLLRKQRAAEHYKKWIEMRSTLEKNWRLGEGPYLHGWEEIAAYLGCATRTATYLEPILRQYQAIGKFKSRFSNRTIVLGSRPKLDLVKIDMANSFTRLGRRWKAEVDKWKMRFYYTKRMQQQGIHVPEFARHYAYTKQGKKKRKAGTKREEQKSVLANWKGSDASPDEMQ